MPPHPLRCDCRYPLRLSAPAAIVGGRCGCRYPPVAEKAPFGPIGRFFVGLFDYKINQTPESTDNRKGGQGARRVRAGQEG